MHHLDRPNPHDPRNQARDFNDPRAFDQAKMTLTITIEDEEGDELEVEFPAKYEVCGVCRGKATHVNPAIDDNGITGAEMAEWHDDEREAYFSGAYDVPCYGCRGKRVVPTLDEGRCTETQKARLDDYERALQDEADYQACCAAERAMGA